MKIRYKEMSRAHNDEHFQFCMEVKELITEYKSETLNVKDQFAVFMRCFTDEDAAYKKIVKSVETENIQILDNARDHTYKGMVAWNNAALNHFDHDVVEAARRLKILFDTYGHIFEKPLNEETSAISNILQELYGKYAGDATKVGITGWVKQLDLENNALEMHVKARVDENSMKSQLKMSECRVKTDKAYRDIVERINAYITLSGDSLYAEFVTKLNLYVDKYANIMAQRAGRAKAKKEKEDNE